VDGGWLPSFYTALKERSEARMADKYWLRIRTHQSGTSAGVRLATSQVGQAHTNRGCGYLKRNLSVEAVIVETELSADALRALGLCRRCSGELRPPPPSPRPLDRGCGSVYFNRSKQTWTALIYESRKRRHLKTSRHKEVVEQAPAGISRSARSRQHAPTFAAHAKVVDRPGFCRPASR
jgi:hypothetical protein